MTLSTPAAGDVAGERGSADGIVMVADLGRWRPDAPRPTGRRLLVASCRPVGPCPPGERQIVGAVILGVAVDAMDAAVAGAARRARDMRRTSRSTKDGRRYLETSRRPIRWASASAT